MTRTKAEYDLVRWLTVSMLVGLCTACAATSPYPSSIDPSTHVERVFQDVTAMMEGMASAHTDSRIVLRGPDLRTSSPDTIP